MNIALILAGGRGNRMGNESPKQFLDLFGKPVFLYSVLAFQKHPLVDAIFVVCHPDWVDQMDTILQNENTFSKFRKVVIGGKTRKLSSYNGLLEIANIAQDDDIVLIHDAARPNITQKIITDNISCATEFGACATAVAVTDTIFSSCDHAHIQDIPNRSTLFSAQTPQSFKLSTILNAHQTLAGSEDITDDAGLLFKLNIPVSIVSGDKTNIKLTTREDFTVIKEYMGL